MRSVKDGKLIKDARIVVKIDFEVTDEMEGE